MFRTEETLQKPRTQRMLHCMTVITRRAIENYVDNLQVTWLMIWLFWDITSNLAYSFDSGNNVDAIRLLARRNFTGKYKVFTGEHDKTLQVNTTWLHRWIRHEFTDEYDMTLQVNTTRLYRWIRHDFTGEYDTSLLVNMTWLYRWIRHDFTGEYDMTLQVNTTWLYWWIRYDFTGEYDMTLQVNMTWLW